MQRDRIFTGRSSFVAMDDGGQGMSEVRSSNEGDRYAKRMAEAEEDLRTETARARSRRGEDRKELEDASEKRLKEKDEAYQAEIKRLKDAYGDSVDSLKSESAQDKSDLKKSLYDQFGKMRDLEKQFGDRKEMSKKVETIRDEARDQQSKLEDYSGRKLKEVSVQSQQEIKEALAKTNASHTKEAGHLKKDIYSLQKELANKQRAPDASVTSEMEFEHKTQMDAMASQMRAEKKATSERQDRAEKHLTDLADERVSDEKTSSTELLRKKTAESDAERKLLEKQFDLNLKQRDQILKKEHAYWTNRYDQGINQVKEGEAKALMKQHEQYSTYAKDQADQNRSTQKRLETQLHHLKTTDNPKEVSAAAEDAIRDSMIKEYEKVKAAEKKSNDGERQIKDDNARRRYEEVLGEFQDRSTQKSRQNMKEISDQSRTFTRHLTEEKKSKEEGFRLKDEVAERTFDKQNRMHADDMNEQKRRFQEVVDTMKDTSVNRISTIKQEAEDRESLLKRDFAYQMGNMAREYEQQIDAMKFEYGTREKESKELTAKSTRENERKTKQMLDEYSRSYQNRLAQYEIQQKERERVLAENYETQLEKIRQSHVLQLKKASEKKS